MPDDAIPFGVPSVGAHLTTLNACSSPSAVAPGTEPRQHLEYADYRPRVERFSASQLEAMHERTPRGGTRWHPSSVRNLLQQAQRRGLLGPDTKHQRQTAR